MTETEWLESTDPQAMLALVTNHWLRGGEVRTPLASDRKLRLFAVACARRLADRELTDRDWETIIAVENLEGQISDTDYLAISPLLRGTPQRWAMHHASQEAKRPERAALLRDLFGNPFRPYGVWQDGRLWLYSHTEAQPVKPPLRGTVLSREAVIYDKADHLLTRPVLDLARAIYDEWAFDQMPILADALEEAGCTNEAILRHLRRQEVDVIHDAEGRPSGSRWGPQSHARGCWVLDLLLGKE